MNSGSFRKQQEKEHVAEPFFKAVKSESGRGCALIIGAFIDEIIVDILETYFWLHVSPSVPEQEKLGKVRAAASVRSEIDLCLALGLLDYPLSQSVRELREIRNHMAHFKGPTDLCENMVATLYTTLPQRLIETRDRLRGVIGPESPRQKFIDASVCIYSELEMVRLGIASKLPFETELPPQQP